MSKEERSTLFTAMVNAMIAYKLESTGVPGMDDALLLMAIANREIERMENLLKDDFK
jgi:hypothetical protein